MAFKVGFQMGMDVSSTMVFKASFQMGMDASSAAAFLPSPPPASASRMNLSPHISLATPGPKSSQLTTTKQL
jgi:hypothetical protein